MALEYVLTGFAELTDQAVLKRRWKEQGEDRFQVMKEDLETQISTFKEFGISAIELRNVGGVNVADFSDSELYYVASKLGENEMNISGLGTPDGKIDIQGDLDGHYKQFERLVIIAGKFKEEGVFDEPRLRIFSYYNKGADGAGALTTARWKEKSLEQVRKREEYARIRGVKISLENEFELFGDTAAKCVSLYKAVNSQDFELIDDASNFIHTARSQKRQNIDMKRAHRRMANAIGYVHIKDMDIETGDQTLPGEGSGEIEYLLGLLDRKKSGKMYLSMEPHLGEARVSAGVTPKEKYRQALEAMRSMISRVYAAR
jgi:sugar phosphate isomerase/epimerase